MGYHELVLALDDGGAQAATTLIVFVPFVYLQGELRVFYVPLAIVVGLTLLGLAGALGIPQPQVVIKLRRRQRGSSQYGRLADDAPSFTVTERGLRFEVNLRRYLDTGLFLDHRDTRQWVRERAAGRTFLNLFAYTGAFTVYAAAGGARHRKKPQVGLDLAPA